jgi:hypothetical protein
MEWGHDVLMYGGRALGECHDDRWAPVPPEIYSDGGLVVDAP